MHFNGDQRMKRNIIGLLSVALLAACSSKEEATTPWFGALPIATQHSGQVLASQRPSAGSIAGMADTGQLMRYQKAAPAIRTRGYTLYPVDLSERHAVAAVVGGELALTAPDGTPISVRYERHTESPDGNWTWIGRVEGGDAGREAIITFGDEAVFGSIPQPDGTSLNLTTRSGQVYVMQANAGVYRPATPRPGTDALTAPAGGVLPAADRALVTSASEAATRQASSAQLASASTSSANTIDLAVGYTNGFAAANGGQSQARTRIAYLVSVANQALTNSQVPGALRLVSATQVTYPDNTDNGDALQALTGRDENGASVTVPAAFQPLLAARETYGADLVALVRTFDKPTNNGCGIAWLNGADGVNIVPSLDDDYGFSVISDGQDDVGDGYVYYCEDHTLAHETAHNMGSAHDVDNSDGQGRYPYSYGYKSSASNGNFYTVMSYGDDGQTSYNVFSNPNITSCGGYACGVVNQADNARSLTSTIPIVSQFRATKVSLHIASVREDVNGDGKSDILFHNATERQFSYRLMNGVVTSSSALIGGVEAGYAVNASGDFDGDGFADLVWTSANNDLYMWTGNGSFTSRAAGSYPSGWALVGAADIDGDGRSDLLFHNATTRQFSYRLMSGASTTGSKLIGGVGAGYTVAAVGDFNGDGKADILWTSAKKDLYMWIGNGAGFSSSLVGTYPSGWIVVGVGDVNGDGKDDLLFHNATTRQFSYRLMSGTKTVSSALIGGVGPGYSVASIGDYNGDGRVDLLWTSAAHDIYMWVGNGSTFASTRVGSYPSGWTMLQ